MCSCQESNLFCLILFLNIFLVLLNKWKLIIELFIAFSPDLNLVKIESDSDSDIMIIDEPKKTVAQYVVSE
jgi:hypothetical protein